jgi:hypothetical protein
MKCQTCGYEHDLKMIKGEMIAIGNEPFIEIFSELKLKINNPDEYEEGDYDYSPRISVSLFACPRCKTVILNI